MSEFTDVWKYEFRYLLKQKIASQYLGVSSAWTAGLVATATPWFTRDNLIVLAVGTLAVILVVHLIGSAWSARSRINERAAQMSRRDNQELLTPSVPASPPSDGYEVPSG